MTGAHCEPLRMVAVFSSTTVVPAFEERNCSSVIIASLIERSFDERRSFKMMNLLISGSEAL